MVDRGGVSSKLPAGEFVLLLPAELGVLGERDDFDPGLITLRSESGDRLPDDMLLDREAAGEPRVGVVRPCPSIFALSGDIRGDRELDFAPVEFLLSGDGGRLLGLPNGLQGSLCSTIGGRKLLGGTRLFALFRSNLRTMEPISCGMMAASISVNPSTITGGDGGGVTCVYRSSKVGDGGGVGGGVTWVW